MRHSAAFALLAALATATPVPQEINIDAIIAEGPPPKASVPIGLGAGKTAVPYDASAVNEDTFASVTAQPVEATPKAKRNLETRGDCDPQGAGYGPSPPADYPDNFVHFDEFSNIANGASTPSGYQKTFTDLKAASQSIAWLGYNTLQSYDTQQCANLCNQKDGCAAFNIRFERDPSLVPAASCPNPPSTTVIRCDFWGSPINAAGATNIGQWRNDFHIVIAGSNGYVKTTVDNVPGYKGTFAYDKAIQAPSDCNGRDTYITQKYFGDGKPFDAARCAAACEAETQFNIDHLNSRSICRFFNTYIMYKNGQSQGQYCALYNTTWDGSYATNDGQWRGNDHWTVGYSQFFSNNADPGIPICPSIISYLNSSPENQAFCSAYINYQAPVTTKSVTSTVTTVLNTVVTSTSTAAGSTVTLPAWNRRHLAPRSEYAMGTVTVEATGPLFEPQPLPTKPADRRRGAAGATPASLSGWPTSTISAACSLIATGTITETTVVATTTEYTATVASVAVATVAGPAATVTLNPNPRCFNLATKDGQYWIGQQFVYFYSDKSQRATFELGDDGHLYSNVVGGRKYQLGSYSYNYQKTGSLVAFQVASTWTSTTTYTAPFCSIVNRKLQVQRTGAGPETWVGATQNGNANNNRLEMLSTSSPLPNGYKYFDLFVVPADCPVYTG
ncbi:hypothetical protein EJ04DRAFT_487589 [Polyplosphaeria fusca]|uniref:Carbohydrate-binding-like protein n=1 Tax=Polyplosphaeria fusca TaxID=682080 RepID=A0A9P4R6H4_9PLEO|nr:hypothetical protein EJ04DRAFT_487589 [Polyplosphaeria fusca]